METQAAASLTITHALQKIQKEIEIVCTRVGRDPSQIHLVAVSKTKPQALIVEAIAAGQRVFGENRVQEALEKFPDLKAQTPDLKLHLLGPLQTNKAKEVVQHFDTIHSVDRPKLVEALARQADQQGRCPECFIQVNTGAEPQKAGVLPSDAAALVKHAREAGLPVIGLMCIPPVEDLPAPHFALLYKLAQELDLPELSMGMSGDYLEAIELGASYIRVGSAIFGARPPIRTSGG